MLRSLLRFAVGISLLTVLCCGVNHFAGRPFATSHRVELFEDGSVHREFGLDDEDRFHGEFVEFRRDGSVSYWLRYEHGAIVEVIEQGQPEQGPDQ